LNGVIDYMMNIIVGQVLHISELLGCQYFGEIDRFESHSNNNGYEEIVDASFEIVIGGGSIFFNIFNCFLHEYFNYDNNQL